MPRLIDAEKLWKAITTRIEEYCDIADLIEIIETQPTVDAESLITIHEDIGYDKGYRDGYAEALEVTVEAERHGHWVENNGRYGWYCSQCKKENNYAYDYNENNVIELQDYYCPNCGAKMDGKRREDETD